MSFGVDINKFAVPILNDFFEAMILDVDVLHSAMKDRMLSALNAAHVVFMKQGRDFVVIESSRQLWSSDVLGTKNAIEACAGQIVGVANKPSKPDVFTACV